MSGLCGEAVPQGAASFFSFNHCFNNEHFLYQNRTFGLNSPPLYD